MKGVASGHFFLEMMTAYESKQERKEWMFQFSDEKDQKRKRQQLINETQAKFGHASSHQMMRLLENVGSLEEFNKQKTSQNEIEKVIIECKICWEKRGRQNKPRNCMKRAVMFNDCLAMDITEWPKKFTGEKRTTYDR